MNSYCARRRTRKTQSPPSCMDYIRLQGPSGGVQQGCDRYPRPQPILDYSRIARKQLKPLIKAKNFIWMIDPNSRLQYFRRIRKVKSTTFALYSVYWMSVFKLKISSLMKTPRRTHYIFARKYDKNILSYSMPINRFVQGFWHRPPHHHTGCIYMKCICDVLRDTQSATLTTIQFCFETFIIRPRRKSHYCPHPAMENKAHGVYNTQGVTISI